MLAALLWGLSLPHTHLCKSQKVFQQKGRLLERFDFSRLHSKKDYFLWLCRQLPRENLQPVSGLPKLEETYLGLLLPAHQWVGVWVGSHGCHLTTGPGKGKVGLATGCQRLAINPCHCWVPTAMWSSSKMPQGWKWGTWEGTTWPLETAKNLCMASSRSLKGKAGRSFELITFHKPDLLKVSMTQNVFCPGPVCFVQLLSTVHAKHSETFHPTLEPLI